MAAFSEIDVGGVVEVRAAIGPTASVSLSGDSNLLPLVKTEVTGDSLRISTTRSVRPKNPLVATIVAPKLTSVSSSGASKVTLEGIDNEAMRLGCSGVCDLTAAGTTGQLVVELSGAGDVRLERLAAKTASVKVSGAGDVALGAVTELDAAISGAGRVSYPGDPVIKKSITGAGELVKR